VEWSERSHLAHLAKALAHTPVIAGCKAQHGLHPSCHHYTRQQGWAVILHKVVCHDYRQWRHLHPYHRGDGEVRVPPPSRVCSYSCLRCELNWEGWFGRRASHHPPDHQLGKTLRWASWWNGSDDSSDGWMTLCTCKQRCKPPSTHRPAWCMTSLVTSGLTLMLKPCKDLSLGEVSGAQVWLLTYLISFPAFLVISSLVLPIGRTTIVAMIASKYCFH
jgi:hypothetical protein